MRIHVKHLLLLLSGHKSGPMTTKAYKYLLFDADGTLYDFHASEKYAIEETWKEFGIPSDEATIKCYLKHNSEAWARMERGEIDIETLKVQRFERFFAEANIVGLDPVEVGKKFLYRVGSVSVLFPQSLPLLTELKKRGYKIYIVTNGVHEVQQRRIYRKDTEEIYEGIYTPEMLGAWKPKREFYMNLFEKLGLDEEERAKAITIGDSLSSDILGGRNAGIDTVWFNPAKKPEHPEIKATYVISDIDELLEMFPPLE